MAATQGTIQVGQEETLKRLAQKANEPLMVLNTVFPFTLFPTKIVIDPTKITIRYGLFFFSYKDFIILIADLKTVSVATDLFFGTLTFEMTGYEDNPEIVRYLPRRKAQEAANLLMGLLAAQKQNLDLSQTDVTSLKKKALEIGKTVA